MSDWGKGATSKKHSKPLGAPKKVKYYDCKCAKCGFDYMLDTPPYSIPGAMSADGYLCPKCRKETNTHAPSPPPENVQMAIEDIFGTKK